MKRIEVHSQAEFDACVASGNIAVVINCSVEAWENSSVVAWENSSVVAWENSSVEARGNSSVEAWGNSSVVARENSSVEAWGNSSVEAWGNSSVVARENSSVEAWGNSSVEAWGNSSVEAWGNSSVEAWGNSSVVAWGHSSVVAWENSSVEAWGNSSVVARENSSVEAWENSSVVARGNSSVEARGNSSVEARGNSSVVAWGNVFIRLFSAIRIKASLSVVILMHGEAGKIIGGNKILAHKPKTAIEWCKLHGVKVANGVATLFKAVDADYSTDYARANGITYSVGSKPIAHDWDGGKRECGSGLHFSPHPLMAKEFNSGAKHFVACRVKVDGIAFHPDGNYPEKVKAEKVCSPIYEVDIHGNKI